MCNPFKKRMVIKTPKFLNQTNNRSIRKTGNNTKIETKNWKIEETQKRKNENEDEEKEKNTWNDKIDQKNIW